MEMGGVAIMKGYESPKAELITFDSENVIATSGCNCYFDRWNNSTVVGSGCYGDSEDAEEILMST